METIVRSPLTTPANPGYSELYAGAKPSLLTPQEQTEIASARDVYPSDSVAPVTSAVARPFQLTHSEVVLIEQFEGWERVVPGSNPRVVEQYLDGAGVPTIGFGTTSADVSPLPRRLTFAQSEALLIRKLHTPYGTAVARLNLPNPNMQAACLSLAYNCGPGILGSGFTIGRALIARDWVAAANAFMLYIHDINGVVEPGLVTRRRTEQALFRKPWANPDPHHYLWFDNTPRKLLRGSTERRVVQEYDRLRALQTKTKHPRRARLGVLRAQCAALALRLKVLGHGNEYRRDWRIRGLMNRAKGRSA